MRSTEGFTLLEVMIALVIMATALVALMGLGNRSILTHERLQRVSQATLLAQQKMSEAEVLGDSLRSEGEFEEPFEAYRWRIEYSAPPVPVAGVEMIRVQVLWGEEAKNELVEFTSFLYR